MGHWHDWSNWEWYEDRRQFGRWRQHRTSDEVQWEFNDGVQETQGTSVPRTRAYDNRRHVDNLTSELANTRIDNFYPTTAIARQGGPVQHPLRPNERADKNCKLHPSKDFKFGKIFLVMWFEPSGDGGTTITASPLANRRNSFSKPRRFLIVDTRRGHSLCLPILTYARRGTTKPGCIPDDHAVIFTRAVVHMRGEEDLMSKLPIRCILHGNKQLDDASRLNYAKVYTIEHNIPVDFIGRLATPVSEQQVVTDYNLTHPSLEDRYTAQPANEEYALHTVYSPGQGDYQQAPIEDEPPARPTDDYDPNQGDLDLNRPDDIYDDDDGATTPR